MLTCRDVKYRALDPLFDRNHWETRLVHDDYHGTRTVGTGTRTCTLRRFHALLPELLPMIS